MQVQMKDSLAGVWANVVNGAKAVLQLALFGDFCRNQLAITNQFGVGLRCLVSRQYAS
jgi:hypothetical protein